MRSWALSALAALGACASSGAGQLYVKSADSAFAGGRWGEAMAGYDAAHNEAPSDPVIAAHRRDAAAKWVEMMAPELAKATPPEKALVLLSALADEGNKRGAEAAVKQHVAAALDSAVARVWSGDEPSDDPKALWLAISRGERLTQSLPEGSSARAKLAALQRRGAAVFGKLAREAKHPASAYLYEAMAARMTGAKPAPAVVKALEAITEFDYKLSVAPPKSCPQLEQEFRKRLAFFHNFDPRGGGLPAEVEVRIDCVPLAPPRQRQESRAWVESHIEYSAVKSCVDRRNLVSAASHTETTSHGTGIGGADVKTTIDVAAQYQTVPDCSTSFSSETVTEKKKDVVTITTEEYGFHANGSAIVTIDGKAYRMPVSARVVFDKVTTAGKIFGKREEGVIPTQDFLPLTAHGLWLELTYLNERAHEGYVADLLKRAATEEGDGRLGDMVSAVRVHHRVTKDYARWFADAAGFDEQEVKELLLDAPRVKASVKVGGDYKLEVPQVDPSVARDAAEKKKASGADDFK